MNIQMKFFVGKGTNLHLHKRKCKKGFTNLLERFINCGKSFTAEKKVLKIQIRFQNDNFKAGMKFERKAFSASTPKYLLTYIS